MTVNRKWKIYSVTKSLTGIEWESELLKDKTWEEIKNYCQRSVSEGSNDAYERPCWVQF